ncbi:hypothetical protein [Streptomyces sp. NPDC005780]|uniref:hypothetical protein n=1 Tax=Streptomyces sp. NPDC005780 TaxID=3364730 RepID=UPI00369CFE30
MSTRTLRRTSLFVPFLALGLAAPLAPALADSGEAPQEVPVARAFTADHRAAKVDEVLKYCDTKRSACRFAIDPSKTREYATAVKSLGNAVVNCTVDPMSVDRTVTLRTSSTDNIGGEISGKVTAEGTVSASGEVTTNLSNETSSSNKTPNLKDGPTSENGNKTNVSGGAKASGSMSAKLAFEAAFKATYSKSWTVDNTETTTYKTVVKPYDMLVFGASSAMRRVVGTLTTGQGSTVGPIAVDSPSMVNSSTFVAQTYAVPDNLCGRTRPPANTTGDDDNKPASAGRLEEVPSQGLVPAGALPKREEPLTPAQG